MADGSSSGVAYTGANKYEGMRLCRPWQYREPCNTGATDYAGLNCVSCKTFATAAEFSGCSERGIRCAWDQAGVEQMPVSHVPVRIHYTK